MTRHPGHLPMGSPCPTLLGGDSPVLLAARPSSFSPAVHKQGRASGGCRPGPHSWLLTQEFPELRAACGEVSWSKETGGQAVAGGLARLCLCIKSCICSCSRDSLQFAVLAQALKLPGLRSSVTTVTSLSLGFLFCTKGVWSLP